MAALRPYLKPLLVLAAIGVLGYLLMRRPSTQLAVPEPVAGAPSADAPPATGRTFDIVTLLPRDAIPAIDNPRFYSAAEADAEYAPEELVLGVWLSGESRAYSTSLLSSHEIVNDAVGGRKIAVTW